MVSRCNSGSTMYGSSRRSFDTWSTRSRGDDDDDSSVRTPVRYVKEGEYDTEFDAEEARRYYAAKERRRQQQRDVLGLGALSDNDSLTDQTSQRSKLFSSDISSIAGDDFSRSTFRTKSTNPFDTTFSRSTGNRQNDTLSSTNPFDSTFSRSVGTGNKLNDTLSYSRDSRGPTDASSIDRSSVGENGHGIDSLAAVLDKSFETHVTNNTGNTADVEPDSSPSSGEQREYNASASSLAFASLRRGNGQQQERTSPATISPEPEPSTERGSLRPFSPNQQYASQSPEAAQPPLDQSLGESSMPAGTTGSNLQLHDLCGEATTPDDVAWRNALYLLSIQPQLATVTDSGGRTPLHVCCMGSSPPPDFMVKALLMCHPSVARALDKDGRLPLHTIAASCADPGTMKLLIEEYPQAISKTEKRGLTPLHILLKNDELDLTIERVRLLLGHVQPARQGADRKEHILRRRGEHLNLDLDQISRLKDHSSITGSALESMDHESTIVGEEVSSLNQYPDDVRVCFRKLDQWRRKQLRAGAQHMSLEIEHATSMEDEKRNPAAIASPETMCTPLHLAVRRKFTDETPFDDEEYDVRAPPLNRCEILRVLASAYPQALVARDAEGMTPLMTTLLDQDCLPNLEVLHLLLGSYTKGYDSLPDWAGDIVLHKARDGKNVNPAMVPTLDTNQLPLHIAAEEMPTFLPALSAIYASYPGAVNVQDVRGRTPLHTALRNYQGIQPDPAVVSLLLTDRVSQIRDDDGCLPFDLLVGSARNFHWKKPRASAWKETSGDEVYRKFFTSAVMQAPQPSNRHEAVSFLYRLQNLPPWLRRQACAADFVQRLLIDEVCSLSACFLILSYGALLIALVVFFRLMIDDFTADLRTDSTWSGAVYILSFVLLICQVCRWYCAASLGVFQSQCLLNLWAWVDFFASILPIGTTILVVNQGSSIDRVAALGTATTGILWLNLVGWAARSWHGMAVFMGGAIKIVGLLIWPLVATACLVVAFAQMFYTLNLTTSQASCLESLAGQPLCNVRDSYIVVYHLLLWSPLVDTNDEQSLSTGTTVLVSTFTLFFLLLIVNTAISVVLEVSSMDQDEVALCFYWEPTLNFVYMTWKWTTFSIGSNEERQSLKKDGLEASSRFKKTLIYEPSGEENMSSSLERLWDVIILAIQGGEDAGRGNMWFMGCCTTTKRTPCIVWPARIAGLLIAPIWIAVGFATCGLFWPPQIRRWLFRPRLRGCSSSPANMAVEYSAQQIAGMRNEMLDLKAMSYETSNNLKHEIRELSQLLYTAMEDYDGQSQLTK